jgi:hypothetical protein
LAARRLLASIFTSCVVTNLTEVIVIFGARTYAVWHNSWIVLVTLGVLGLTCIILDSVIIFILAGRLRC